MNQSRWKSPVTLLAIATQLVALLVALGVIDLAKSETINTAIAATLQIFVVFGVLNNPTNHDGF